MIIHYLSITIFLICILLTEQTPISQSLCSSTICEHPESTSEIQFSTRHKKIWTLEKLLMNDEDQNSPIRNYGLKFFQFTFTMSEEELRLLVFDIVELYHISPSSLFYLSFYFKKACELLESQKIPHDTIYSMVEEKMKFILNITSVSEYQREKQKQLRHHEIIPIEWKRIEDAVEVLSFKRFSLTSNNKSNEVEDIIIEVVGKAENSESLFVDLVENSCKTNKAELFKYNFKIKEKKQSLQMRRIKEKLLKNYLEEEYRICFNSFFMVQKHMLEIKHFEKAVDKVLLKQTEIEFVVKDILRAKCEFTKKEQIYEAALTIISRIEELKKKGKQIKLIEFENRLHRQICDIMLVVEIENLGYEIQLAMDVEKTLDIINHKVYEFRRSLVFNPISMLFIEFDIIASKAELKHEEKSKLKSANTNKSFEKEKINRFGEIESLGDLENLGIKDEAL